MLEFDYMHDFVVQIAMHTMQDACKVAAAAAITACALSAACLLARKAV
jgi:hypothetical protein